MTCAQFGAGLVSDANIPVHTYLAGAPDPVIDPLLARVATVDTNLAVAEVQGIYGSGTNLQAALSGELSLISKVLYPAGTDRFIRREYRRLPMLSKARLIPPLCP